MMAQHKSKRILSTLLVSLVITACSTSTQQTAMPAGPLSQLSLEEQQTLIRMLRDSKDQHALLQSWKESQSGVKRLLVLESDLKLLIEQLGELAAEEPVVTVKSVKVHAPQEELTPVKELQALESDQAPALAEKEEPVPLDEPNSPVENTPEAISTFQLINLYAIQLTAMSEAEKLATAWHQLVAKQPQLLGSLTPRYESVALPKGTFYRLKAGEFEQRNDAEQLCMQLQGQGISCLVSQYGLEPVALMP